MKKLMLLLASAVLFANSAEAALSEKLRVLSIDLGNAAINTPGMPSGEVAQELRGLLEKADPDVLCLQGATDWETCERIANRKRCVRIGAGIYESTIDFAAKRVHILDNLAFTIELSERELGTQV